ncbi:dihydrodipicolinate synthase family protein [Brevibacterium senegalense]|uniref:dihydrodipicolinate synthase family protein n=1 Tax=Brevibacterium senegalense TaxID=1033736 RepID=UPI0003152B6D|nr:dihydrodipicolinate synthase family protein [Brevibacterium senegalense]
MFTGLSAFPLTPVIDDRADLAACARITAHVRDAGVDSITVLGSTGLYAYFSREERRDVTRTAVQHAGDTPVIVGVGALRTRDVRRHVEDAQEAGAAGVLLAPMSYHPLTRDEVYALFEDVTRDLSVPLAVYDNPTVTRFTFDDDLYAAIATLPGVASIKIPGVPAGADAAARRVAEIRARIPDHVTIGVSGDAHAARGLIAGCDAWYSVIAGTVPQAARTISDPAGQGDREAAQRASDRLSPLWDLFAAHGGSLRVVAALAELRGLSTAPTLPRPLLGLDPVARAQVAQVAEALDLS